jgi:hypothetical protein
MRWERSSRKRTSPTRSQVAASRRWRPLQGSVSLFDGNDIEPGGNWSPTLSEALCKSKVFVPIYPPTYFAEEYCGREWQVFRIRLDCFDLKILTPNVVPHARSGISWSGSARTRELMRRLCTGMHNHSPLQHLVPASPAPEALRYRTAGEEATVYAGSWMRTSENFPSWQSGA